LQELRSLFPVSPYFAGYGNKETDVAAYEVVGIPRARIFIIDKAGSVRHQTAGEVISSYGQHAEMVDYLFPPFPDGQTEDVNQSFQGRNRRRTLVRVSITEKLKALKESFR